MGQYIDKAAVVAEIERRIKEIDKYYCDINCTYQRIEECRRFLSFLDTLKVKEVDFEKEMNDYFVSMEVQENENIFESTFRLIAKHFFELGMRTSRPITSTDKGMAEEIIVNLKRIENDYRIDLTKEIGWLRNISACK